MPPKRRAAKKAPPAAKRPRRAAASRGTAAGEKFKGCAVLLGAGTNADLREVIEQEGGEVKSRISNLVTHVLLSDEAYAKGGARVRAADDRGIPLVKESFIDAALVAGWRNVDVSAHQHGSDDAASVATEASDGDDADSSAAAGAAAAVPVSKKGKATRAKAPVKASKKASKKKATGAGAGAGAAAAPATPAAPKMVKQIAKGGIPIDPQVPQAVVSRAHVLVEANGEVWDVLLNQTNMTTNNNKFYILQLLQDDTDSNTYWTYFRWGRVGYTGQDTLLKHSSIASAKSTFCEKFTAKTSNDFSTRHDSFVPRKGKYTLLHRHYGDDDDESAGGAGGASAGAGAGEPPPSKLHERVQDLITTIFDTVAMAQDMAALGYDANKMPLGKLSEKTVKEAYTVLSSIADVLTGSSSSSARSLADLSAQFYTLIPHDFGFKKTSLFVINNQKALKTKLELVQSLGEAVITKELLKKTEAALSVHPIDQHYLSLKAEIAPVAKGSAEMRLIQTLVRDTTGLTHTDYDLSVVDALRVDRSGERDSFLDVAGPIGNRRLLWHGSRTTNFGGILSQGLRIAPPEAPVTGYMFGKGVYFANCVTKSANYCGSSEARPVGLMLLCEVALGKSQERLRADYYASELESGTHSTWGRGKYIPDPAGDAVTPDGVGVSKGRMVKKGPQDSALLYDEFSELYLMTGLTPIADSKHGSLSPVVYNTKQIRVRYIVKMHFDYT